jgi:hypothetical protein
MQSVALGFEPRGLLSARIDLPYTKYNDHDKIVNFDNAVLEGVRHFRACKALPLAPILQC